MSSELWRLLTSSVAKKQIVALTGLALIGYILLHLLGNFMIFGGPDALNGYAEMLHALGPLLWAARVVLAAAAVIHIVFTVIIWFEDRASRPVGYTVSADFGSTTFAKKTMIYTGLLLFFFLFLHLWDFTFADKAGEASVVWRGNDSESLGLFGVVWNSFLEPWRIVVYLLAVSCVGFHLSHGVQSFLQTLGLNNEGVLPKLERLSNLVGILVAVGYSFIPIYVVIRHYTVGPP